jgi:glycine C-acetyltransferase
MRPDPLRYLQPVLDELRAQGLCQPLHVLDGGQRPRSSVDGRVVINLASDNYLGLAAHPRLTAAATEAVGRFGVGATSIRTIAGTTPLHVELERRLSGFERTESALLFQSGFAASAGTVSAILGRDDVVVSDELNHASIIDGCRLSRATIKVFPHRNVAAARRIVKDLPATQRKLIVTDGVFCMDGDLAPLPALCSLAEEFGAIMMVDDAHAVGVFGANGRGSVDHFGLQGRVDVQVGTLSKALGVAGGYAAGTRLLVDVLRQRARPFLYSTAHPPAVTAASLAALDVLEEQPEIMARLWENTGIFRTGLEQAGFNVGTSESPIVPVLVGSTHLAMQFSERLLDRGVFAPGVGFPVVPRGLARVRTIVTAAHTREDLQEALEAFRQVGRDMGLT